MLMSFYKHGIESDGLFLMIMFCIFCLLQVSQQKKRVMEQNNQYFLKVRTAKCYLSPLISRQNKEDMHSAFVFKLLKLQNML